MEIWVRIAEYMRWTLSWQDNFNGLIYYHLKEIAVVPWLYSFSKIGVLSILSPNSLFLTPSFSKPISLPYFIPTGLPFRWQCKTLLCKMRVCVCLYDCKKIYFIFTHCCQTHFMIIKLILMQKFPKFCWKCWKSR